MLRLNNTNKIYRWAFALSSFLILSGCNKEWEGEQYEKYLSFVDNGINRVHIKYEATGGKKTYRLPVQVSGTEMPKHDIHVKIALDPDTIKAFNYETYRNREDLYAIQLDPQYYNIEEWSTVIEAGTNQAYIDIDFSMMGLDNYHNYLLPLQIEASSDLPPHPRKHFKKSLVYLDIFNDYSGTYSLSEDVNVTLDDGQKDNIKVDTRYAWTEDENTIFFYGGIVDEEALDRKDYRIYAKFIPRNEIGGDIEMYCPTEDLISFEWNPENCYYVIEEEPDAVQPYLIRRFITMTVDYSYMDVSNPTYPLRYGYNSTMIMDRTYNMLLPEEDRIIW